MTKDKFDKLQLKQGDIIFVTPKSKLQIWGAGFFYFLIYDRSYYVYIAPIKSNQGYKKYTDPYAKDAYAGSLRAIKSIEVLKRNPFND